MKIVKEYLKELKERYNKMPIQECGKEGGYEFSYTHGEIETTRRIISEIENLIDINENVNGMVEIKKERIEDIKEVLKFYSDGKHYEWDGCRCHGHYVINDKGDMADSCLNRILNDIDIEEDIEEDD